MTQLERLYQLNSFLLNEMPQYKKQALSFGKNEKNQFQLFRSLVNVRPPMPASFQFLKIQDEYLQAELRGCLLYTSSFPLRSLKIPLTAIKYG